MPSIQRVARGLELDRLAFDREGALAWLVHAGQGLDQGRFAGTVVAEQAEHLAGIDGDGDVLQRDHRAEELRHALHVDQGGISHQRDSVTFLRMKLLNNTAIRSMAPRNTLNQSVFTPGEEDALLHRAEDQRPQHGADGGAVAAGQ